MGSDAMTEPIFSASELRKLPTICVGQCCSLKIEELAEYHAMRVWLCRVGGGVTIERYRDGKWITVSGGCEAPVDR